MASPAFAGDYCVVVCDARHEARDHRACPSPTVRSSEQMSNDLRLIARGEAVAWPLGALVNGFVSFCSASERQAVMAAVAESIAVADADRRRQLADFTCMVAPRSGLSALDTVLKRSTLTRAQRKSLSQAREHVRMCARR